MPVARRIALVALLAIVAPVSTSDAATVSRFADSVVYTSAARKPSDLHIKAAAGQLVFRDRRQRVAAGIGCVRAGRHTARCDLAGVAGVAIILGSEDDILSVAPSVSVGLLIRGGAGNDRLQGGSQGDDVTGGPGQDAVDGQAGNDIVNGGSGDDVVAGSQGDDVLDGGDGDDDIQALDGGRDQVDCGGGVDSANAGSSDRFVAACDLVRVTNSARTSCDPGTAATRLKPVHPRKPLRSLQVKVTGANRPTIVVVITIYTSTDRLTVRVPVPPDGDWHFVRKVGPKANWARGDTQCPI